MQTQLKEKTWYDGQGIGVPLDRITKTEKLKERYSFKLASDAFNISRKLGEYKEQIRSMCHEVFTTVMTDKEMQKATKGNFTWYNFNGSIKIEVSINENIEFDGMLIEKAKQKLLELVQEGISKDKQFLKELIVSAFQTSHGKLDTKKIMALKKHAKRITDARYHDAMALIDEAGKVNGSKTYYRVWVKDEHGQYQNIDLNFSSI